MKLLHVLLLVILSALLLAGTSVLAQGDDFPVIEIDASASGFTAPADLPSGAVTLSYSNSGEGAPFMPFVGLLNEGVTEDAFNEALASGGPDAALALITMYGGTQVLPGEAVDVTYDFAPGTYMMTDFAVETPSVQFFSVAEGGDGELPEADVHVRLLDFAISLPVEFSAGEQTWLIDNQGDQWHEMLVMPIDPATSVEDVQELLHTMGGPPEGEDPAAAAPPPEPAFFWLPISAGQQALVDVTLEPGTYLFVCFLPDIMSGHAHNTLGMVQIVNVVE